MHADRILADLSLWRAALDARLGAVQPIFAQLRRQQRLTAPPATFGHLLAQLTDPTAAETVRVWATETPPAPDPLGAWISAGDLAAHLRRRGVDLDLHTALITALAVREELPVWSLDPVWDAIAAHLPIRRFDPDPSPYTR